MYQQEELDNHRRFDMSAFINTPGEEKIESDDPDDKKEFSFQQ